MTVELKRAGRRSAVEHHQGQLGPRMKERAMKVEQMVVKAAAQIVPAAAIHKTS
jgi:hypothetical protein